MRIEGTNLFKTFVKDGQVWPALRDLSFHVSDGEFVSLLGPSGCGKTTVMNMVAGLDQPSQGSLTYNGETLTGPNVNVGYMTQKDSLLPWRSAAKNIALALEIRGVSRSEAKPIINEMIELVGLAGFERHFPHQLSGGMRKRVLMARTLAYAPETLLMDEPFGNLDAQLKLVMQDELLRIWTERKCTVLFVTHDIAEAILLSDRILVLGARPGHLRKEIVVDLPRPRDVVHVQFTDRFAEIYDEIWETLKSEYLQGEAV